MGAAIDRVDVVGEGIDLLVIAIVVLDRYFDRKRVADLLKIDRLVVQHILVFVEVLHELGNAAAIIKLVRTFRFLAFVMNGDTDALVEKSLFAQAFG